MTNFHTHVQTAIISEALISKTQDNFRALFRNQPDVQSFKTEYDQVTEVAVYTIISSKPIALATRQYFSTQLAIDFLARGLQSLSNSNVKLSDAPLYFYVTVADTSPFDYLLFPEFEIFFGHWSTKKFSRGYDLKHLGSFLYFSFLSIEPPEEGHLNSINNLLQGSEILFHLEN